MNEEGKCEEDMKKINLIKKYNIDLSVTQSILHFDDFQFYLTKIILSEIWIFRLTNLTEKSNIINAAQHVIEEKEKGKEKEKVRLNIVEKIDSGKDEIVNNGNVSEKNSEDEKKSPLENDKKIKNNIFEVRKKSLGDKKKENKGKDNISEKEFENENGDEKDCDGNRSPSKRTAVRTKTIDEEKVTAEVNYLYNEND